MDLALKTLISEVEIARENYHNANPEYHNIATHELMAAEDKLNQYIREKKTEEIRKKTFQPPTEKV